MSGHGGQRRGYTREVSRRLLVWACLAAAASAPAACGSGTGGAVDADPFAPDADLTTPDADPTAPDADPTAPDADPAGPDAAPPFPNCLESCSTPAECVVAGSPLFEVDNYACDANRCRWLGCTSTSECTSTYGAGWTCSTVTGNPLPTCYESCGAASDCVIAGTVLYDVDNWTCDAGKCRWLGCSNTSECTTTFMDPDYSCQPSGAGFDTCWPTCSTPADCSNPASTLFDTDNWACQGGLCRWQGCNSTSECTTAYMNPAYVCEET